MYTIMSDSLYAMYSMHLFICNYARTVHIYLYRANQVSYNYVLICNYACIVSAHILCDIVMHVCMLKIWQLHLILYQSDST